VAISHLAEKYAHTAYFNKPSIAEISQSAADMLD